MGDFPPSVTVPVSRTVTIAVAVIAAVAAGLGGYALGRQTVASSPSPGPSGALSITAAGALATVFPRVAQSVANASPTVSAPVAAQRYQGSLDALNAIAQLHQTFDVAAAADYRLIPKLLEPNWTAWEVVFATSPVVLAYDPAAAPLSGLNPMNWPMTLQRSGVLLGVANASIDPVGYNTIFALELESLLLGPSASSVYAHFYFGAPGAYATPNPADTRIVPETQVAALLHAHTLSASFVYRAYALSQGLAYVALDPRVNLGALDPASLSFYARASTTVLTPGGPLLVRGAPVAFAATVPRNAPNAAAGALFVHVLLSPSGAQILLSEGFAPVFPGWTDRPGAPPAVVAPDTVALPPTLAAQLAPG